MNDALSRRRFLGCCTSIAVMPLGSCKSLGGHNGVAAQRAESEKIPTRIRVKPVFMVPSDGPQPTAEQSRTLMTYLQQAKARYHHLLHGQSTFELAAEDPAVVSIDKPLAFFNALPMPDSGEHPALLRMFEVDHVDRYSCPYVYVIALTGVRREERFTGATINGGPNNGGGIVMMDAERLVDGKTGGSPQGFLSIIVHELGHTFGLVHVAEYGYSMKDNLSYMSYSSNRTMFLPEELRVLGLNKRVFPDYVFEAKRDIPASYQIAPEPKYQAGPIGLEGQRDFLFYPVHFRSLGSKINTSEATFEVWAKANKAQWDQCFFELNWHRDDEDPNRIMAQGPRPDGSFFWDFGDWKDGGRLAYNIPDFGLDEWTHFAFVVSGRQNRMSVYVNGALVAQKTGVSAFNTADLDLFVGCGKFPFFGDLKEFRAWNYARPVAEIKADMKKAMSGQEPGLLAYYAGPKVAPI